MRSLTIHLELRNAAFQENCTAEIARILRKYSAELLAGEAPTKLRDINGSVVGHVQVK